MSDFYCKEDFIKHAKQQIIENNDLITALEIAKKTLEKFDGRVINKRIETAVNTALCGKFEHAYFDIDLFTDYRRINITVRDHDSYHVGQYSVNYVDYSVSAHVSVDKEERMKYPTDRLNYDACAASITETIESIRKRNEILRRECENIDIIERDFQYIDGLQKGFKKIHSSELNNLYRFR